MTKKFIRNTMIGFCVFIAVIIITYVAVTYLYKASAAKTAASVLPVEEPAAAQTAAPLTEDDVTDCEYYLARFNGKGISIFACSNGNEEFLYTIDVRARIFQQMNSQSSKRESSSPTSRPSPHLKKTLPDRALL